jgi:hypothetical protein
MKITYEITVFANSVETGKRFISTLAGIDPTILGPGLCQYVTKMSPRLGPAETIHFKAVKSDDVPRMRKSDLIVGVEERKGDLKGVEKTLPRNRLLIVKLGDHGLYLCKKRSFHQEVDMSPRSVVRLFLRFLQNRCPNASQSYISDKENEASFPSSKPSPPASTVRSPFSHLLSIKNNP